MNRKKVYICIYLYTPLSNICRYLRMITCNMHYSMYIVLQCVAVCCSVLQCVAVCCSVLQSVAMCCKVVDSYLRMIACNMHIHECKDSCAYIHISTLCMLYTIHRYMYCNTLQHTATHCNTPVYIDICIHVYISRIYVCMYICIYVYMYHRYIYIFYIQMQISNTCIYLMVTCNLQHTAAHCSTLPHTATHCNTLLST